MLRDRQRLLESSETNPKLKPHLQDLQTPLIFDPYVPQLRLGVLE
jgi:hypothetical protein